METIESGCGGFGEPVTTGFGCCYGGVVETIGSGYGCCGPQVTTGFGGYGGYGGNGIVGATVLWEGCCVHINPCLCTALRPGKTKQTHTYTYYYSNIYIHIYIYVNTDVYT